MEYCIPFLLALEFVLIGLLFLPGKPVFWRGEDQAGVPVGQQPWPKVSLVVPVTGASAGIEAGLKSLLAQDYSGYEVILVTCDDKDEAVPIIRRLLENMQKGKGPDCRHIQAGRASTCGQKNRNLLVGVEAISPDSSVIAFADSVHQAAPDWLRLLVHPIARGETDITTGYHHVIPEDCRVITLARTATVLALYRMQESRILTQPWGGNTAIKRDLFERLKVRDTWVNNVVDDVSLAVLLKKTGVTATPVREAWLSTPLTGETCKNWLQWLTRQWLYLKYCFPVSWAVAGMLLTGLSVSIVVATCEALLLFVPGSDGTVGIASLAFLSAIMGTGISMRRFHPQPGPLHWWMAAVFVMIFMAALTHQKTWFTREIRWRNIRYRVTFKGRVTDIRLNSN